jgi:hypothetical protein
MHMIELLAPSVTEADMSRNQPQSENALPKEDDFVIESWPSHEHLSAQLELDALRLLSDAGTPELAKFAIDSVEMQRERARDEFAQAHGFANCAELLAASDGVATGGEKAWFVTLLVDGQWIGWNLEDFGEGIKHRSREAAVRFVTQSASKISPI